MGSQVSFQCKIGKQISLSVGDGSKKPGFSLSLSTGDDSEKSWFSLSLSIGKGLLKCLCAGIGLWFIVKIATTERICDAVLHSDASLSEDLEDYPMAEKEWTEEDELWERIHHTDARDE